MNTNLEKLAFALGGAMLALAFCVIVLVLRPQTAIQTFGGDTLPYREATNTHVGCGTSSTLALATSSARTKHRFVNDSSNTIYLALGDPAVGSNGIRLNAGGGSFEEEGDVFYGAIYCIASSTSILTVQYSE